MGAIPITSTDRLIFNFNYINKINIPKYRINNEIKSPSVMLIDEYGNNIGIVKISEALDKAFINSKNVLSKWHAMSIMVNKIRKENETLAIRSEFLLDEDTDIKFKENNKKIINIMKEALAIVGNKAPKNCYARLILKN